MSDTLDSLPLRLQVIRGIANRPDCGAGRNIQAEVTLGSGGTITTITLPEWARGFRLTSGAEIIFAIDEDPAALVALSGASIDAANFGIGGISVGNSGRLLRPQIAAPEPPRTLRLRSVTGAASVIVEIHG